jgi:hypothetical protein
LENENVEKEFWEREPKKIPPGSGFYDLKMGKKKTWEERGENFSPKKFWIFTPLIFFKGGGGKKKCFRNLFIFFLGF